MSFEIKVNDRLFTLWESAQLSRSIDRNVGVFNFVSTTVAPSAFPVKIGDAVQIVIDEQIKLTGYVDSISASGNNQTQSINVSGRDNLRDLIDSSVPDAAKSIDTPISMKALCERVLAALGLDIKVINQVEGITDFGEDVEINADSGKKCLDFLLSFARTKQVYLVSDGQGNLVIYRPARQLSDTPIIQNKDGMNNNIKAYNFEQDDSIRYHNYCVRSQDNFGSDPEADYEGDGVDRQGCVQDNQIAKTRYLEIQAEETMDEGESLQRANEEANVRRSQGFNYSVDLVGTSQNNGILWDFGLLVSVKDDLVGLNGIYMIKDVSYSINRSSGTETKMKLTRPDAYQVTGNTTQQDQRIAPLQNVSQNANPDEVKIFNRRAGGFGK